MKQEFRLQIGSIDPRAVGLKGKELEEMLVFLNFVQSEVFWESLIALRPKESKTDCIRITQNSEGDDPPDFIIHLQSGDIGIEITDCSQIAKTIMRHLGRIPSPAQIPSPADIKNPKNRHREALEFMSEHPSLVQPHFTDLAEEHRVQVEYLTVQIAEKDIPGNQLLLLGNSFMGSWPEDEPIRTVLKANPPKHIKQVVLVSQNRCTLFL